MMDLVRPFMIFGCGTLGSCVGVYTLTNSISWSLNKFTKHGDQNMLFGFLAGAPAGFVIGGTYGIKFALKYIK